MKPYDDSKTAGREDVVAALKKARKRICSYGSEHGKLCDCKFNGGREDIAKAHGESGCGCPELYVLLAMVENMTDKEYARLRKRTSRPGSKPRKPAKPVSPGIQLPLFTGHAFVGDPGGLCQHRYETGFACGALHSEHASS